MAEAIPLRLLDQRALSGHSYRPAFPSLSTARGSASRYDSYSSVASCHEFLLGCCCLSRASSTLANTASRAFASHWTRGPARPSKLFPSSSPPSLFWAACLPGSSRLPNPQLSAPSTSLRLECYFT